MGRGTQALLLSGHHAGLYNYISPVAEEVYLAPEYICHFFPDSLSTDSSDFKSAGCRTGNFGQFDI